MRPGQVYDNPLQNRYRRIWNQRQQSSAAYNVRVARSQIQFLEPLPHTRVYSNADEWVRQVMLPANEEFRG